MSEKRLLNVTDIQAEHSYSLSEDSAPQSPALSIKMDEESGRSTFSSLLSWFMLSAQPIKFLLPITSHVLHHAGCQTVNVVGSGLSVVTPHMQSDPVCWLSDSTHTHSLSYNMCDDRLNLFIVCLL